MSNKKIFICTADDMHPMNCDTPYGGNCVHCERKITKNHHPGKCELCDPEYDYQPNKYWKK